MHRFAVQFVWFLYFFSILFVFLKNGQFVFFLYFFTNFDISSKTMSLRDNQHLKLSDHVTDFENLLLTL